ncbi:MAG: hypothetical protein ISS15_13850 [Alphaproteobacteria bacterium]|nr:hypothetical protein [Alphaproteobacteria bacterium]MBL7098738.1 hypothetical protein [Alphaproteobacteria bacterium]
MRLTTFAFASTAALLTATGALAKPYACALCQPLGSDCTEEVFSVEPILAEVSGAHFERTVSENCTAGFLELGCDREYDRLLYTFASVKIVQGEVSATPVELQTEYDYRRENDPEWGGVYLQPDKTYLVAIADTRIFNRRFTIKRACELYPPAPAPAATPETPPKGS